MDTDEQLMLQAARGDMDAFEELVERHQKSAINIAYRFLGNAAHAEDVAQEAFLRILAGASRYRPTAAFRTYLYNVIYHLCVDAYRRKQPGQEPEQPPALPANPSADPAQAAISRERSALVQKALEELPARQRMAIVLKHYEGMSYEEIGRAIGCSPSAVDALLVRAKRTLKERLRDIL